MTDYEKRAFEKRIIDTVCTRDKHIEYKLNQRIDELQNKLTLANRRIFELEQQEWRRQNGPVKSTGPVRLK